MNDRTNNSHPQGIHLPRRLATASLAALAAVLLLSVAVASLAQASGTDSALRTARAVIPPSITNPHITATEPYLYAEGTTVYYGDGMGNIPQDFWLAGDAEGTDLDRVECAEAFNDGPYTDSTPADGWQCGTDIDTYDIRNLNDGDGVITATLYNITDDTDTVLFYYIEDLLPPTSTASSPAYANSLPIMVGWIATDTESGPAETCLWVSFEGNPWTDPSVCQPGISGTMLYDPSGAQDGTYYFQTVSKDNVSNEESPATGDGDTATFLDTADPIASVQAPTSTSQLFWEVQWSAVDPPPGSGIDFYDVSYRVDTGAWDSWFQGTHLTSTIFGPSLPVPVRGGHSYAFQVRAYDQAGNYGDSPIVTTTVKIPPLHIPLLVRNYAPLTNGGFEEGWAGWTHGGELAQSISMEETHSGTYAALLGNPAYPCEGGVPLGSAWIERTFSIPSSGVSTLRIWYLVWSEDKLVEDDFDRFEVWIDDSLALRDGNDGDVFGCDEEPQTDGWEVVNINVEDYAGQRITLRLENWNSFPDTQPPGYDWFNTWTYVDDIQLLP
jgi:hypothetical protein